VHNCKINEAGGPSRSPASTAAPLCGLRAECLRAQLHDQRGGCRSTNWVVAAGRGGGVGRV